MAKNRKPRARPVHSSIKIALGYDPKLADQEVLQDWSERKRRVCKPCWELKYCPYGPLVEQSPVVPPLRPGMIEQNAYFRKCLETDMVGDVRALTEELRAEYQEWLEDDQLLLRQALHEVRSQHALDAAARAPDEQQQIAVWLGGDIPPIHIYRAPFDHSQPEIRQEDFPGDFWQELLSAVERIKQKYRDAIVTGVDDYRHKLEPVRRAWFERQLDNFDPDNYSEEVAQTFQEAECNIFGHVCPVFFAAESVTETQEARRIGRHQLPFATMMRIVRRDDYRCQHCKKRLRDDEVEFDHIIPVSKGGSSEEHNLRLTCFDCNRDKSDEYKP
jgi:hypothetical protein